MKIKRFPIWLATVAFSSISLVFSVASARAADFVFNASFTNGYSAKGSFTTKSGTPPSFSERNPSFPSVSFTTQFLQSLSLSIFDNNNTLLQTGTGVVNGISTNRYLRLDYDRSTNSLPALNINTDAPDRNPYYFIGNNVTPEHDRVPFGDADYQLFMYNKVTNAYTFLGSTTRVRTAPASVPEASPVIGLLGLAALGASSAVKRKS